MKFQIFFLGFICIFTHAFAEENTCVQEFQAINKEWLNEAQSTNTCAILPIPEQQKETILSAGTIMADTSIMPEPVSEMNVSDILKLSDINIYVCKSSDGKSEFMVQSYLMELTEESMKSMEDEGNRCMTQVIWFPKTDSFKWTPSSNYGWTDLSGIFSQDKSLEEAVGGFYFLSSNKTLSERLWGNMNKVLSELNTKEETPELNTKEETKESDFSNFSLRDAMEKKMCLQNFHKVHDEIIAKARLTRNCNLLPSEGINHDERRFYSCTGSDGEKNNPLKLLLGAIFISEGTFVRGCQLYASWAPVSGFDWTPANQKEDWIGYIGREAYKNGITGSTMNWMHANPILMESFSNLGRPVPYKKADAQENIVQEEIQENVCTQEYQAIKEEILAKARLTNTCSQARFIEGKKAAMSNLMGALNSLYSSITETNEPVERLLDTVSFICVSPDEKKFKIHLTSLEMTEQAMDNMELDKENRCATNVMWSPEVDAFQWTPSSSSNYGWIKPLPGGGNVGGFYVLSSNKTFMERFSSSEEAVEE